MRLFLQINVGGANAQPYTKPLLSFASSLSDDVLGTDLDDQSDPYVVNLVKQLIDQSEQTFLLVVASNQHQPLDNLLALFNHLHDNDDKVHLAVLSGEHDTLCRFLRPFEQRFVQKDDEDMIKKMIKQFVRG